MSHTPYTQQLDEKIHRLHALFADLPTPPLTVHPSAPEHYRMRAEFRIWHEGDAIHYAMFAPGQKASTATLQRIRQFPPACDAINALMPRLLAAAAANPVLKYRWYQVEFLATLAGDMLVTMIYHRALDDAWEAAARTLQDQLGIAIIGRSKGQKRVLHQDFVTERLTVPAMSSDRPTAPGTPTSPGTSSTTRHLVYRQPEGAFTQPNARVCQQMIGWACAVAQTWQAADARQDAAARSAANSGQAPVAHLVPAPLTRPGGGHADGDPDAARVTACGTGHATAPSPAGPDLLELYCGNGNFSIPLAAHFRQVLATEISKTAVAAAQWNIAANGCHNLRIARLSAEEFTQAWQGQRTFRRLQQAGIQLGDYDFGTVLVDPPRAGVDDDTLRLLQRFARILYISCNPDTLRANLDTLCQTHTITRFALFDQFPFTPHMECGVALQRRPSASA